MHMLKSCFRLRLQKSILKRILSVYHNLYYKRNFVTDFGGQGRKKGYFLSEAVGFQWIPMLEVTRKFPTMKTLDK